MPAQCLLAADAGVPARTQLVQAPLSKGCLHQLCPEPKESFEGELKNLLKGEFRWGEVEA